MKSVPFPLWLLDSLLVITVAVVAISLGQVAYQAFGPWAYIPMGWAIGFVLGIGYAWATERRAQSEEPKPIQPSSFNLHPSE